MFKKNYFVTYIYHVNFSRPNRFLSNKNKNCPVQDIEDKPAAKDT